MGSTTMRMTRITSCMTAAAAAVLMALAAGCSLGGGGNAGPTNPPGPGGVVTPAPQNPVSTTDSDWKPVVDALGRSGKLGDNNTAYRVALTRTDLQVTSYGVAIKP